ncbi:MAG TPA: hypothetical protein VFJ96_14990 [Gemmatimonadaceae bacterium]|jgi:hypothetical protein|nr:hypothetical protein [Gemmatimonadaceae bacterium]
MFFRARQPETSIWRRFRTSVDGFSFAEEDGYHTAHVVANAERTVDLFLALAEHMPPAVDIAIDDARTGRRWHGEGLALPDVRDVLARVKPLLATFGGVEISIFTREDQVTLNAVIELFIYARTDRWLYILQGKGLEERETLRAKSWKLKRHEFPSAPELVDAIAKVAETLRLTPAST